MRRLLSPRGWRWLVAFPFALGLTLFGLAHLGGPPPAAPAYSPWSLIAR